MFSLRILEKPLLILWSKAKEPLPLFEAELIQEALRDIPGLLEAHLPFAILEGDSYPGFVLVLATESPESFTRVGEAVLHKLLEITPQPFQLQIVPFALSQIPSTLRETQTQIYPQ